MIFNEISLKLVTVATVIIKDACLLLMVPVSHINVVAMSAGNLLSVAVIDDNYQFNNATTMT